MCRGYEMQQCQLFGVKMDCSAHFISSCNYVPQSVVCGSYRTTIRMPSTSVRPCLTSGKIYIPIPGCLQACFDILFVAAISAGDASHPCLTSREYIFDFAVVCEHIWIFSFQAAISVDDATDACTAQSQNDS